MTAQARHVVEHVLPAVPVRQWVLTLPHPLRYRLGYDADLCRAIHRIFTRKLRALYRARGRRAGRPDGEHGAITAIQRFGGGLNLNVHFHTLVPDGTFHLQTDGSLHFEPMHVPTQAEVERVLTQVVRAVITLCQRRGLLDSDEEDPLHEDSPTLAACYDGAVRQRVALGPRRGQPVIRLGEPWFAARARAADRVQRTGLLAAELDGFSLHGRVAVGTDSPQRLERLVRYCLRPALSEHRLQLDDHGRYRLELKTQWRDGTTHLRLDPMELMERVVAQIPKPGKNLLLYSGVFAPRARLRAAVVHFGRQPPREDHGDKPGATSQSRADREKWAELMRHAFGFDVLQCPRCPGRLSFVAVILRPATAQAILRSLRQLDAPLAVGRVRDPPPHWDGLPLDALIA